MSSDYKAMSREKDTLDFVPTFAFWRNACHTFAKNVCKVTTLAKNEDSISSVLAFMRSLPWSASLLSTPEWRSGVCSRCLEKALESVAEGEKEDFKNTVLDYFLFYFPERDRFGQLMLVDAFVGFVTGIAEAQQELEKEEKHEAEIVP